MKKILYICLPIFCLLVGCSEVEDQILPADQTYFSFVSPSTKMAEKNQAVSVKIDWAKLSNVAGELEIETTTEGVSNPAVEGRDYTLSKKKIQFGADSYRDSLIITTIDNDQRSGDRNFIIRLKGNNVNAKLGSTGDGNNQITVTIVDDEHPYSVLLGDCSLSFKNSVNQQGIEAIAIVADEEQEDVLWISGLLALPMKATASTASNGDITLVIALPQEGGPNATYDSKYEGTIVDGTVVKAVHNPYVLTATTKRDKIELKFDNAFALAAHNPTTGVHLGVFTGWMLVPGTVVISK